MDSITQAALGAVVGELAAGRKIGDRALLFGAVAGSLPDLDIVLWPFLDDAARLLAHRSATHSLIIMPAAAWLLAQLAARWRGGFGLSRHRWLQLFLWCFVTHIFIDLCTVYGTQIFFPLSRQPFAFSSIFIVDPIFTIPLLAAIAWLLLRRVKGRARTVVSFTGLAFSGAYLFAGIGAKLHADAVFADAFESQGVQAQRRITFATPFNILLWRTAAMTDTGNVTAEYSLLDCADAEVELNETPAHFARRDFERLAQRRPDLGALVRFSKGFYRLEDADGKLAFTDLRFGFDRPHPFRRHIGDLEDGTVRMLPTAKRLRMDFGGDFTARLERLIQRIRACRA